MQHTGDIQYCQQGSCPAKHDHTPNPAHRPYIQHRLQFTTQFYILLVLLISCTAGLSPSGGGELVYTSLYRVHQSAGLAGVKPKIMKIMKIKIRKPKVVDGRFLAPLMKVMCKLYLLNYLQESNEWIEGDLTFSLLLFFFGNASQ